MKNLKRKIIFWTDLLSFGKWIENDIEKWKIKKKKNEEKWKLQGKWKENKNYKGNGNKIKIRRKWKENKNNENWLIVFQHC